MAKTSFYLLVNQTAGEKACKKTAGKEDLSDFVGRYERCSISGVCNSCSKFHYFHWFFTWLDGDGPVRVFFLVLSPSISRLGNLLYGHYQKGRLTGAVFWQMIMMCPKVRSAR